MSKKVVSGKNDRLFFLLLVSNCLFLIYYVLLACYSRFHFDDIEMMGMVNRMSLSEFVEYMYLYRSGRFVAYGCNWLIYKTVLLLDDHRFFPVFILILGYGACWMSLKHFVKKTDRRFFFMLMVFAYNIYVFTNLDNAQYTWLCAMIGYLTVPLSILFLLTINQPILKWYNWLLLVMITPLLGTKESYTPLLLFFMLVNTVYYLKKYDWHISSAWNAKPVRRMALLASIMVILLLVVIVAPGNYVRMNGFEMEEYSQPLSLPVFLLGMGKSVVVFFYFIFYNLPYYCILAVLFVYAGKKFGKTTYSAKAFGGIVLVYCLFVVITAIPNAFLFRGFGYKRGYTSLVFMTILFISIIAYMHGSSIASKKDNRTVVPFLGVLAVSMAVLYHIVIDTPTVVNYADCYDERMARLEELQEHNNNDVVYVDLLPIPYTTNIKYDIYKLIGRRKNPRPVLYYVPDQPNRPTVIGTFLKDLYHFDYDIILNVAENEL